MARNGEGSERGGRGGGRGGGRDRAPMDRETQVSKKLSWLLRHGAEKEGLKLGRGGYVGLGDVLSNRTLKSLQPPPTLPEIQQIVATNAKQRFSLITLSDYQAQIKSQSQPTPSTTTTTINSTSPNPAPTIATHYLIRANQGHSLSLSPSDLSELLTPLKLSSPNLPETVVHGTSTKIWSTILSSGGLKPMSRTHIHFATGVPGQLLERFGLSSGTRHRTAPGEDPHVDGQSDAIAASGAEPKAIEDPEANPPEIKSGMRNSSTLLIFIDLRKALEARIEFFVSENGVVLTAGDEDGVLGVRFFGRVVEKGGGVLVRDGVVLGGKDEM